MLLGIAYGQSKPQRLPIWRARSICQWLDEDLKATRPHIKLVTQTGAIAKEDELLHGELGAPWTHLLICSRVVKQDDFVRIYRYAQFMKCPFLPFSVHEMPMACSFLYCFTTRTHYYYGYIDHYYCRILYSSLWSYYRTCWRTSWKMCWRTC